jgi:hypothetical protein
MFQFFVRINKSSQKNVPDASVYYKFLNYLYLWKVLEQNLRVVLFDVKKLIQS